MFPSLNISPMRYEPTDLYSPCLFMLSSSSRIRHSEFLWIRMLPMQTGLELSIKPLRSVKMITASPSPTACCNQMKCLPALLTIRGILPRRWPNLLDFTSRYTVLSSRFLYALTAPLQAADSPIQKVLKAKNRLIVQSTLNHSYPFCWRSVTQSFWMPGG